MKEIITSILETTKDRLKNPFIGAFIFSWVVFNWKPIFYIMFSENSTENKITYIEDCFSSIQTNLLYPLLFSIGYMTVLPYVLWAFDIITSKAILGRKSNVLKLNLKDIDNKQKIAEEESELENIKSSYRDRADLNKKIDILINQIEERDKTIDLLNIELSNMQVEQSKINDILNNKNFDKLTDSEKSKFNELYKEFKDSDIFEFFEEIGSAISRRNSLPSNINDIVVEKYKYSDIIIESRDDENQRMNYEFTKKGEYFWRKYIMNVFVRKKQKEDFELPF